MTRSTVSPRPKYSRLPIYDPKKDGNVFDFILAATADIRPAEGDKDFVPKTKRVRQL